MNFQKLMKTGHNQTSLAVRELRNIAATQVRLDEPAPNFFPDPGRMDSPAPRTISALSNTWVRLEVEWNSIATSAHLVLLGGVSFFYMLNGRHILQQKHVVKSSETSQYDRYC